MKSIKIYLLLFSAFLLMSLGCRKLDSIASLNGFNVTADKQSYNIGDTVTFSISQDADVILFYSGKPGFNVNYRNRNLGSGTNILKFQTALTQASTKNNGDTILLKICNNLTSYDSIGVANANWVDITNLANWPTVTTSGFVRSGAVDISKYNTSDSVYIAFQVLGKQNSLTSQRKWQIQGFTLSNTLSDSTFTPLFAPAFSTAANPTSDTLPSFINVGWAEVNMNYSLNPINPMATTFYGAWNVGSYGQNATNGYNVNNKPTNRNFVTITTNYPLTFDPSSAKNTLSNNGWVITSPVNLNLVRHDFPSIELKDEVRTPARGLKYLSNGGGVFATYKIAIDSTFKSGQTYDMGFVAQDRNVNQFSEIVKHVSIKVN